MLLTSRATSPPNPRHTPTRPHPPIQLREDLQTQRTKLPRQWDLLQHRCSVHSGSNEEMERVDTRVLELKVEDESVVIGDDQGGCMGGHEIELLQEDGGAMGEEAEGGEMAS